MPKSFTVAMIIFILVVIILAFIFGRNSSENSTTEPNQALRDKNTTSENSLPSSLNSPKLPENSAALEAEKSKSLSLPIKPSESCQTRFSQYGAGELTLDHLFQDTLLLGAEEQIRFQNITIKRGAEFFTYNIKPKSGSTNPPLYQVEVFKRDAPNGIGEKVEDHPLTKNDQVWGAIESELASGQRINEERMVDFRSTEGQNSTAIINQDRVVYLESSSLKCDGLGKTEAICQCW